MKILVTSCPTYGHFFPLVPICWALRGAGHEVLAAMPGKFSTVASSSGVNAIQISEENPFYSRDNQAAQPPIELHDYANSDHKARVIAAVLHHVIDTYVPLSFGTADSIVELAKSWQPDLVLHTPWEYSGPLAATLLDIPRVSHSWGVGLPEELAAAERDALRPLLDKWGVERLRDAAYHLDICPPSLQYKAVPENTRTMRYIPFNGSSPVEPWLMRPPKRTRVCVSIGSVPIENGHGNLLVNVIEALGGMNVEGIVLTGGINVPAERIPDNVQLIANNIPLKHVLQTCDLVIHHGGSGSTMTSTSFGLPQLAIPQMCDQFRHAERLADSRAGIALTSVTPSPTDIRDAAAELLSNRLYRDSVAHMRAEIRGLTHPGDMVARLGQLVM